MGLQKEEDEGLLNLGHMQKEDGEDEDDAEKETKRGNNGKKASTARTDCCKKRIKAGLNHMGLFVTLMLYTALGGLIFCELEYPVEVARLRYLEEVVKFERHQLLQQLNVENIVNAANKTQSVDEVLRRYEWAVQEAAKSGVLVPFVDGHTAESLTKWNSLQAIFFASTVLTTIGYGNLAPVTVSGRWFCMLFALIGIPLTLTVMADLGRLLAGALPRMPRCLTSSGGRRGAAGGLWTGLLSAGAALAFLLTYLAVGAALFITWEEEWNFFQAFYFCFITMTTIGFGDLVPQTPKYMLLCTLYILVGLSITSTIIELVRQQYAQSWRRIQALAEALGRIAAAAQQHPGGTGGQQGDANSELRRALAAVTTTLPKTKEVTDSRHWEKAIDRLVTRINTQPPPSQQSPPLMQIIIYESSV